MEIRVSSPQPIIARLLESEIRVMTVLVKEGDEIKQGTPLFEYEDGKAIVPYLSPSSGYIKELHIKESDLVGPQSMILTFGQPATAVVTQQVMNTATLPERPRKEEELVREEVLTPELPKLSGKLEEALPVSLIPPAAIKITLTELALMLYSKYKVKDDPYAQNTARILSEFVTKHDPQLNNEIIEKLVSLTISHGGYADGVLRIFSQIITKVSTPEEPNSKLLTQLLISTQQVLCTDAALYLEKVGSLLIKDRSYSRCLQTLPIIVKGAVYEKASDLAKLIERAADLILLAADTAYNEKEHTVLRGKYRSFNTAVRGHEIETIYHSLKQQAADKVTLGQLLERVIEIG